MNGVRLVIVSLSLVLSACASMEQLVSVPESQSQARLEGYDLSLHQRSIHRFDPVRIAEKVNAQNLEARVANIVVLVDEDLADSEIRGVPTEIYSREIIRRFLKTVPNDAFDILLASVSPNNGTIAGLTWSRQTETGLNQLAADQPLPALIQGSLADALQALAEKLNENNGATAIVVFTEWNKIDQTVVDAISRLQQYSQGETGETITAEVESWSMKSSNAPSCVHLIGLNNYLSRTPANMVTCGLSKAADAISQPADMAFFVERILFKGPRDSDNDGVFDYLDKCPNTSEGRIVNFSGCSKFSSVQPLKGNEK